MTDEQRLRVAIQAGQRLISRGERPGYHARWRLGAVGTEIEIEVLELPGVSAFVESRDDVAGAARKVIARELDMPEDAFDVEVVDQR